MSSEAIVWAWRQDLPPEPKLTLLALAEDANHHAQCWPAKAMLQQRTGLSDDGLKSALTHLKTANLIHVEDVPGSTHKYFLDLTTVSQRQAPAPRAMVPAAPIPEGLMAQMTEAVRLWNEMADRTKAGQKEHKLPKVRVLNDALKKHLKARLEEAGFQVLVDNIQAIERNAHCRGVNERKWQADFAYLVSPSGFTNTANGRWKPDYEERTRGGTRTGTGGRGDQRLDNLRGFDAAIRGGAPEGGRRSGGGEEDRGDAGAAPGGPAEALPGLPVGGPDTTG